MIQTPYCDKLHADKYRSPGENHREAMNRVASALKDDDVHYHAFRSILHDLRFLPGGRVQAAMGSTRNVTAYNCFLSASIQDSFTQGHNSIMECATRAAETMRMGGGIGYDFSPLRPRGAMIRKLQSTSSGPVSFMHIFNAVCQCVSSSGHRRGAQMGVLRVDHPDIEEFIHAKREAGKLEGFNISVAVTDEFMEAVRNGASFPLQFEGHTYKEIDARALWENIMRSAWDWAEPGVLFIDTINRMNNLAYCEAIAATNPCGEQPLPPDGACLLGSFNLVKYLRIIQTCAAPDEDVFIFDFDQFKADIPHVVRAMDNVIDRTIYPLYEQEREAKAKRRMGLGVTGLANALEAMGYEYGSTDFVLKQVDILRTLMVEAYRASAMLAEEKGAFPAYDERLFLQSGFLQQHWDVLQDEGVWQLIAKHGMRNSHLTSIAPTGTISMTADNVSSGIEPVFAYSVDRVLIGAQGAETIRLQDYGHKFLGVRGKRAQDVTLDEHLAVLRCASLWCDSAVSKTCNINNQVPWEDFKRLYFDAWEAGVKGCTVYNVDGKRGAVLTSTDDAACRIDAETGRRECD